MRKQRLTALRIGISRGGLALLGIRSRLRRDTAMLSELSFAAGINDAFDEIGSRLDEALRDAQAARLPATVVIADDLARFFMVTPPPNAAGMRDYEAAAGMRFKALYGESPSAWNMAADWNAGKPFLACALPRTLLDAILRAANTHRLTLIEVVPHFVAAWNTWSSALKPDAWFGVLHDDTLNLGAIADEHMMAVKTTRLPTHDQHGLAWLERHIAREALLLGIDAPSRIQLCGSADERWTTPASGPLACEWLGAVPNVYTGNAALALAGGA